MLARLLGSALGKAAAEERLLQESRVRGGVVSDWLLRGGGSLDGGWRGDCSLRHEPDLVRRPNKKRKPQVIMVREATIGNWQPEAT